MPNGIFPEWLNCNAGRAYPLIEDCSRLDSSRLIRLPDSLVVDAQICGTLEYSQGVFFISGLKISPSSMALEISYADTTGPRLIALLSLDPHAHFDNSTYPFVGNGLDACVIGSLTIGALEETLAQVPGTANFDAAATPFESAVLFVMTPAVKSVALYNGDTLIQSFSSILKLRPGENIRMTVMDPQTLRIDAILKENVQQASACANALPVLPCIKTINGVGPDESGNFNLEEGTCITVDAVTGKITLADKCSQSCCSCTELASLVEGLKAADTQVQAAQLQINSVINQQATLISGLVANIVP